MSLSSEDQNDSPLTPEQEELVNKLKVSEIERIDEAVLSNISGYWKKVASVVGATMMDLESRVEGILDIYYANRIIYLAEKGLIESQGNLK
jgi:hypothetical protein